MSDKITFTVFLFNEKFESDLGVNLGRAGEIHAKETVLAKEIESVRECADDDAIIPDRCSIRMKSGMHFHAEGSYASMLEQLLKLGW